MSTLRMRTMRACEKIIITTRGDIDLSTATNLETELQRQVDSGEKHVVLNLSHTSYMDSSGLAVLLRTYKHLQNTGGRLSVIGCAPNICRIFNMVGFHHLFTIQEKLPSRLRRIER